MFNSDVLDRVGVGVDLANARDRGLLPGTTIDRPGWIFEAHGFLPPARATDWRALTLVAEGVAQLLRLVAAGEHQTAVTRLNQELSARAVTPFVESVRRHLGSAPARTRCPLRRRLGDRSRRGSGDPLQHRRRAPSWLLRSSRLRRALPRPRP